MWACVCGAALLPCLPASAKTCVRTWVVALAASATTLQSKVKCTSARVMSDGQLHVCWLLATGPCTVAPALLVGLNACSRHWQCQQHVYAACLYAHARTRLVVDAPLGQRLPWGSCIPPSGVSCTPPSFSKAPVTRVADGLECIGAPMWLYKFSWGDWGCIRPSSDQVVTGGGTTTGQRCW